MLLETELIRRRRIKTYALSNAKSINIEKLRNFLLAYVGIVGSIASTIALLETRELKEWLPWLLFGGTILAIYLSE